MDADGKVVCSGSGDTPPWSTVSCAATSDELLTASARKRVFVTSATYKGSQFISNPSAADTVCQNEAASAGLTGTYKALMYNDPWWSSAATRYPAEVLATGKRFMHCGIVSGKAEWWEIASNPAAMLGTSLPYPIKYTAAGSLAGGSSGVTVWTNFQPTGGGSYNVYDWCPEGGGTIGYYKQYGNTVKTNVEWAYIRKNCCGYASNCYNTCIKDTSRALYCVQQ